MARSFDLVDFKIAEAEFFLSQIPLCGSNFFVVQCYVSAFVSSMRSVTFSLQACLSSHKNFKKWYKIRQDKLKNDRIAKFFHKFRTINQHIGENPINGGSLYAGKATYWFTPSEDFKEVPDLDVETACRAYFIMVLSIIYDCYIDFGTDIDPQQHYTYENYKRIGKTIEDAEEEVIGIRGWTEVSGYPEEYRWQAIRKSVPICGIDNIFRKYLERTLPKPDLLPNT